MSVAQTLSPARELVAPNTAHFPNESAVYRTARNALLVEEIELRRHIEDVAAKGRALPLKLPPKVLNALWGRRSLVYSRPKRYFANTRRRCREIDGHRSWWLW
jgi:hypothetical protein